MKRLFLLLLACVFSVYLFADTWKDSKTGITWTYSVSSGTATIGDMSRAASSLSQVIIPSSLGGCPVIAIGDKAFRDCNLLSNVTIPEGLILQSKVSRLKVGLHTNLESIDGLISCYEVILL